MVRFYSLIANGGKLVRPRLVRAVQVPAGRHKLTFEFQPVSGALAELSGMVLDERR